MSVELQRTCAYHPLGSHIIGLDGRCTNHHCGYVDEAQSNAKRIMDEAHAYAVQLIRDEVPTERVVMPTYEQIEAELQTGKAPQDLTALKRFIYFYDDADPSQSEKFIENLRQVVEEARRG